MTANEWLGVMKQAQDFPKGMEKLIIKYGEMLIAEHESKVKKLTIPDVSNRFFKWFYTIFITGLAAILNYCFDIPQPILSGLNLLLIAIAANKIADQHNRLKNGC